MLSDRQVNAGLSLGLLQGIVPGAAALDATQRAAGVGPVGSPRFERSKFVGQILGGALMTVMGGVGMTGGGALVLSQVGAAIGIPATSMSFGLAAAGVANTLAGWQGLWQSLATGGSAGPPGVSAGPAAPVTHKHHIATNKNSVSDARGGPWTPRFDEIFKRAGMSMDDPANIIELPGHYGPHPELYHREVFNRLDEATAGLSGDAAKQALIKELSQIRIDILKPGSSLHKLLTGK